MLAGYGCGMTAYVILNGPFCGHVWLYDPNARWFVPFSKTAMLHYFDSSEVNVADAGATFTFASWYEHWIDHALEQAGREYEGAA
jgi:hypothetical protein